MLTVTPKPLTVTGTNVSSKTYNGNNTATLIDGVLSGLINGDNPKLTQAGSFATPNAGTGIHVTVTDWIGGASAANYILIEPHLFGTINRAPLAVTGLSGTNRAYDGTRVDSLTGNAVLVGLVGGQTLAINHDTSGTLASPNVGSERITTAITLGNGTGLASNYSLTQPTLPNVTISPR